MFLNGADKAFNGNSGLYKSRPNTITIVSSINLIADKNLDKAPHLTHSISLDGEMAPLKLLPSIMSHAFIQKKVNEDMK